MAEVRYSSDKEGFKKAPPEVKEDTWFEYDVDYDDYKWMESELKNVGDKERSRQKGIDLKWVFKF